MVELTIKEQMEVKGGDWVIFTDYGVFSYATYSDAVQAYYAFEDAGWDPSWPGETQQA